MFAEHGGKTLNVGLQCRRSTRGKPSTGLVIYIFACKTVDWWTFFFHEANQYYLGSGKNLLILQNATLLEVEIHLRLGGGLQYLQKYQKILHCHK